MFVVMALVTTVSTTPLTSVLYPPWYQRKLESWKRGEIDWDGNSTNTENDQVVGFSEEKSQSIEVHRLLVHLRLDSLPSLFTFITLLGGDRSLVVTKTHRTKTGLGGNRSSTEHLPISDTKSPLQVHGVRLLELTERSSSVMKVYEADEFSYQDPVVNAFRTFSQLSNVAVSGAVSIVPESSYAETLAGAAADNRSDLMLIPWNEEETTSEDSSQDKISNASQDYFIQKTLDTANCNTAVFINRGFGIPSRDSRALARTTTGLSLRSQREPTQPVADRSHHIYFPYFGGADDHIALRFVLQLAQNTNVTATIIHFIQPTETAAPEISGGKQTQTQAGSTQDTIFLHTIRDSLPPALSTRVVFVGVVSSAPIADSIEHARQEVGQSPKNAGDLIVVGRARNIRSMTADGEASSSGLEMRKTLGVLAEALISGNVKSSVLVVQARGRGARIDEM